MKEVKECNYCGADIDYIAMGGVCDCGMEWIVFDLDSDFYVMSDTKRLRDNGVESRCNNIDDILENKRNR